MCLFQKNVCSRLALVQDAGLRVELGMSRPVQAFEGEVSVRPVCGPHPAGVVWSLRSKPLGLPRVVRGAWRPGQEAFCQDLR
jgi:hypothetical protein